MSANSTFLFVQHNKKNDGRISSTFWTDDSFLKSKFNGPFACMEQALHLYLLTTCCVCVCNKELLEVQFDVF